MVFTSLTFLFIFLPISLILYFIMPKRHINAKNVVLLILNLIFYAYGEPKNCIIMIISITANYFFGLLADKDSENKILPKLALILSVFFNIGILIYYKYSTFIFNNLYNIFGISIPWAEVVKPIGISFFTFQGLSYIIDVYRGNTQSQKNIFNLALYISLFPQLIAGPIVRYETVASEIENRTSTLTDAASGIRRFMTGFAKKLILANSMGIVADAFFNSPASSHSVVGAWLAPVGYAFQIYFDFSAYSDMAIGLGKILGFHFLENFNYPYISTSITEFWRRWHISLGTWFKDYVYIPLGGNRCKKIINIRNIFIVWILTGIWHGAAWKFVLWGLFFGVILILEKLFILKILNKIPKPLQHLYAIILIIIGWSIFRSHNINYLFELLKSMFCLNGAPLINGKTIYYLTEYRIELLVSVMASLPLAKLFYNKYENIKFILCFIVFIIGIICMLANSFNPFIYFRF